jgi:C_GCAxxG_C_C family probable redox protein
MNMKFDSPDELVVEARAYFDQGFNCAQAVFAPFAKRKGLDESTALMIATPFGGGMGHAGQTCGAVSGALMAIGLAKGTPVVDREKKSACYALAKTFQDKFREIHGSVTCPGLLGLDIGNPEETAQARSQGMFSNICPDLVGDAVKIVCDLLSTSV